MSLIDERNRKFTYKELCAKYGFTEFPNGEKKNRQLQKLKDEYNLCQVGRYYVFRDPMVKEAIEEFVDPLEVENNILIRNCVNYFNKKNISIRQKF